MRDDVVYPCLSLGFLWCTDLCFPVYIVVVAALKTVLGEISICKRMDFVLNL